MTLAEIKILVEKYFEGETSLQEEALLSDYFNGVDVATELKPCQPLFQFFKIEKSIELSEKVTEKIADTQKPTRHLNILRGGGGAKGLWWRAAAAVLIIGVSSYFIATRFEGFKTKSLAENSRIKVYDETEDAQKAYEEVQAALKLVSKKMKKGTDETTQSLKKVKHVTDEVNQVIHISH